MDGPCCRCGISGRASPLNSSPVCFSVLLRQVLRQTPATAAPPAPREDPAKRLVAVVDNADNPFFITADGSRYFTGALLPSGHRVVQIAERSVWVERDGQRLRLTL